MRAACARACDWLPSPTPGRSDAPSSIQRRGITALFDLIVTSAEEGVTKPDARIYQTMLDRLCMRPAEAVFIDDNNENVQAARAIGIRSILFVTNEQTIADLDALLVRCGSARD